MVMAKKAQVVLILAMLVVCFSAYAYGAKSDPARVILSTIYFKNDSVALAPEFENDLKKVQAALEADPAIHLQIEGYGRNHSTPARNREIAQKRAETVQQWFVKHGVAASRLEIGNFGGSKPADQKDTPKNPAYGERVEILQVSLKQPSVYLPAARYQFAPVMEGREVTHDFVVQNKGSAILEIQKVKTD
jgi:hypothetical protein